MRKSLRLALAYAFVGGLQAATDKTHTLESFSALYNQHFQQSDLVDQFQKMERIRSDAQNSLDKLLKVQPNNLELRLRYGELLLQRARDLETYSLELDTLGATKEAQSAYSRVRPLYEQGLKMHYQLLPSLRGHSLEPNVYLGIARTEASLGRKAKALDTVEKIIPRSGLSNEIKRQMWLLKADLSFDLSRASMALEAYKKADSFSNEASLEKSYVAYKMSWCYFNLKEPNKALQTLKIIVDSSSNRLDLKQDAVQDFALFAADLSESEFKEWGESAGIFNLLKKGSSEEDAYNALSYMGRVLFKNGQRKRAIAVNEYLISEMPRHPQNGDLALALVDWTRTLADQRDLTEKFLWLLNNFSPKSNWYSFQKNKPDIQKSVSDRIEQMLRAHAVGLHKELQNEKSAERKKMLLDVTSKLYDAHIETFTDFPRIHYYRAEVHREQKEWQAAGEHYDKYLNLIAAYSKPEEIDKKFKLDAALGSVDVWARALGQNKSLTASFLSSVDQFTTLYPKHELAAKISYDAAQIEFENKKTALALGRIQKIVDQYPKTDFSVKAVHTALDILNQDNDFANLAMKARDWLNSIQVWAPKERVSEVTKELNQILSKTEAKACEFLSQDSQKLLEAALCFQRYAIGFEREALAPKSLFLSADLFEKWGDHVSAMDSLERLVDKYPKSEEAVKGFGQLANVYEKTFQFQKASKVYEQLLSRDNLENREKVYGRLLRILYGLSEESRLNKWMLNKQGRSREDQNIIAGTFRDKSLMLLKESYKLINQKDSKASAQSLDYAAQLSKAKSQGLLPLDIQLELARWEGLQKYKNNELGKADEFWMAGLKSYWKASSRQSRDTEAAARLRLTQLLFWKTQFDKADLKSNPQKKLELYQKLESGYAEVINMKAPSVALEALWETAKLFDKFGDELLTLPQTKAQGTEMKTNAQNLLVQIAKSATEWKILSPVVTLALQKLRGIDASSNENGDALNNFPWPRLPRWTTITQDQQSWDEWSWSDKKLQSLLKNTNGERSRMQRAALVLLFKENSLKSQELKRWAEVLTQAPAVQLRIQAMMNDGDLRLAELYLEQYEDIIGKDAFDSYFQAQLDWLKGDYTSAFRQWSNIKGRGDFRSAYTAAAWSSSLEQLLKGRVTSESSQEFLGALEKVSDEPWQKIYLAALCAGDYLNCPVSEKSMALLKSDQPFHLQPELQWAQRDALGLYSQRLISTAKNADDLLKAREVLELFGSKARYSKLHIESFNKMQKELRNRSEQKLISSTGASE